MALSTIDTSSISGLGYGFKNRVINGGMMIDQRNAGASVAVVNGSWSVDRWQFEVSASSKLTAQQSSVTPAGFSNSMLVTCVGAYTPASGDTYSVRHHIEGYNFADMGWGTSGAATVTLSFWVRSSLTGTFGGSLRNDSNTRSYPLSYTINSANTWEQKTIVVAGDTTGTWEKTTARGVTLYLSFGSGSSVSAAAGSWASGNYVSATGASQLTNGATFYITGVQLEAGTVATSFDWRPYGTELALCQRYYQLTNISVGNAPLSTRYSAMFSWTTPMRATPTFGQNGVFVITDAATADYTQSSTSITVYDATPTGGYAYMNNFTGLTTTRLFFSRFSNSNMVTLSSEL